MDMLKRTYQAVVRSIQVLCGLAVSIVLCASASMVLHLGTALLLGLVPLFLSLGFQVPGIIEDYPEGMALRIGDVTTAYLLAVAGCVVGAVWGTVRFALRKRA